ncbi:MAG: hypothetical protein ACI8WB_004488 [Phenylobacterium sp.]|jgi:hypothetical protein
MVQMKTRLPLYTPSLLDQNTLEAIFVKREPLLSALLEAHLQSVTTDNKHFSLFIGPRGIGKTHLLSLFFHRIQADPQLAENTVTAWLREEEWGIACYLDLLIHILNALKPEFPDGDHQPQIDHLYQLNQDDAEQSAEQLLLTLVGSKTLLLITENMDLTFDGLGKDGQHKFRALIQNSGKLTIVGAAQSLFTGVTLRNSPFYGFFDIQHLQPLDIDEAVDLLIRIAEFDHKPDLVTMLKSSKGRVRVRALHHLASGNPRIYVTFSQLIQADSLDEFTDAVLQMLDELTPYYQAKMLQISPQQRKLVQFLCRQQGTTLVTDIAKFNHLSHQATSAQLKKLRDGGYVASTAVGRASHYEIAEPLMRLVLEVKEARATPVRLLINFLRHWFSSRELGEFAEDGQCIIFGKPWIGKDFVYEAIERNKVEDFYPQLQSCIDDYMVSLERGDSGNLDLIKEDLEELGESTDAVVSADPEGFDKTLKEQLGKIFDDSQSIKNAQEFKVQLQAAEYLHKNHTCESTSALVFLLNLKFIIDFAATSSGKDLSTSLKTVKGSIPENEPNITSENIEKAIRYGFWKKITNNCKDRDYNSVISHYKELFNIAETLNSTYIWQFTCNITIIILGDFINKKKDTTDIWPFVEQLEQLEPSLNDEEFSTALVNTLIFKIIDFGEKQEYKPIKTTFDKIQMLAEKYNNKEIWIAYGNAIAGAMPFTAIQAGHQFVKLLNKANEITYKHQSYFTLFYTVCNVWGVSSLAMSFKQLLEFNKQEAYLKALVENSAYILKIMVTKSIEEQQTNYPLLWSKIEASNLQAEFIPGINQAGLDIAKQAPDKYSQWLDNLSSLLENTPELEQSHRTLIAIKNYLDNDNDESQLLVLQKEERELIREGLGLVESKI